MKYEKIGLVMLLMMLSTAASGNAKVIANGGDAVVCYDSSKKVKSAQILDYFELSREGHEVQLGEEGLAVLEKVEIALIRFKRLSPLRAVTYTRAALEFLDRSIIIPEVGVPDIADSGDIDLPSNCELRQVVVQISGAKHKKYLIDQTVWDLLDNENKAGMILHELIISNEGFSFKIDETNKTTKRQRVLNGLISADPLKEMSLEKFWDKLYDLGFRKGEFQGRPTKLISDSRSKGYEFYEGTDQPKFVRFSTGDNIKYTHQSREYTKVRYVSFHIDGTISSVWGDTKEF